MAEELIEDAISKAGEFDGVIGDAIREEPS